MKTFFSLAISTLLISACQQSPLPTKSLPHQNTLINVRLNDALNLARIEFASTTEQRANGLMNRSQLATNDGMLFTFDKDEKACFWMKNTIIPLTIGFIDSAGILVQITDMQPQTLTAHCPKQSIRYALEMNQGWFARNRVDVGTQILKISLPH